MTTYVHDYLKEGEELRATGPYGKFYLKDSDRDILFIATGSGMAPIQIHASPGRACENPGKDSILLWCKDSERTSTTRRNSRHGERQSPYFSYVPTLSRPPEEDHWQGEKGRVTNLIEKYIPEGC